VPYQGWGIGESSLAPVAPAIANAIEDAVGVRITDLPITAEKVLRALRKKKPGQPWQNSGKDAIQTPLNPKQLDE